MDAEDGMTQSAAKRAKKKDRQAAAGAGREEVASTSAKRMATRTPPSARAPAGKGNTVAAEPPVSLSSEELLPDAPDATSAPAPDAASSEAASIEHAMEARLDEYLRTNGKQIVGDMVKTMVSGLTRQVAGLAVAQRTTDAKLENVGSAVRLARVGRRRGYDCQDVRCSLSGLRRSVSAPAHLW